MNKLLTAFLVTSLTVIILTGCDKQEEVIKQKSNENFSMDEPMKEDRQGPWFERPDLMGEISEIKGNQVTLKVLSMANPDRNRNNKERSDRQRNEDWQLKQHENTGNEYQNEPTKIAPPTSQTSPITDKQNKSFERPKRNYTGENQTLSISDTVNITRMQRTENGSEDKVIAMKDLQPGEILQVWFSNKEKKVVSKVTVRKQGQLPGWGKNRIRQSKNDEPNSNIIE